MCRTIQIDGEQHLKQTIYHTRDGASTFSHVHALRYTRPQTHWHIAALDDNNVCAAAAAAAAAHARRPYSFFVLICKCQSNERRREQRSAKVQDKTPSMTRIRMERDRVDSLVSRTTTRDWVVVHGEQNITTKAMHNAKNRPLIDATHTLHPCALLIEHTKRAQKRAPTHTHTHT
jgi:hypothetical protein